jgi:hypothetical protein
MSISSIKSKQDCDVLLSANQQLEKMYYSHKTPCLALHISRNYHLLQKQDTTHHKKQWKDKAKIWWKLYWMERASKGLGLFYDENGLFFDNI